MPSRDRRNRGSSGGPSLPGAAWRQPKSIVRRERAKLGARARWAKMPSLPPSSTPLFFVFRDP